LPRTIHASVLALLCACATGASAQAAPAADGGASYGASGPAASVGEGGTLVVRTTVLAGNRLHVRGTLAGGEAGRPVTVERRLKDGSWRAIATTVTTQDGAFDAVWKTQRAGRFVLRAVPTPSAEVTAASVPATGETQVSVFRQAVATYFGPGFFGKRTACGQVLRRATLGVAHRTLPCGTLVDLYYKGATITVPVIDRGPFREGTTWDLTSATAEALKMTQTARIGALRTPTAPPAGR
jgi:hypothetical protein